MITGNVSAYRKILDPINFWIGSPSHNMFRPSSKTNKQQSLADQARSRKID